MPSRPGCGAARTDQRSTARARRGLRTPAPRRPATAARRDAARAAYSFLHAAPIPDARTGDNDLRRHRRRARRVRRAVRRLRTANEGNHALCIGKRTVGTFLVTGLLVAARAALAPIRRSSALESRAACAHDPLRQPFFGRDPPAHRVLVRRGDLDTRNTPADAYRYAKGGRSDCRGSTPAGKFDPDKPPPATAPLVALSPYCLPPALRVHLRRCRAAEGRALDWAAIDHAAAQISGESNIWPVRPGLRATPTAGVTRRPLGQELQHGRWPRASASRKATRADLRAGARDELTRLTAGAVGAIIGIPENGNGNPPRPAFCDATSGDGALPATRRATSGSSNAPRRPTIAARRAASPRSSPTNTHRDDDRRPLRERDRPALLGQPRHRPAVGRPPGDGAGRELCVGTYPGSGGSTTCTRNIIFRNDFDVLPGSRTSRRLSARHRRRLLQPYPIGSRSRCSRSCARAAKDHPADNHPRCDVLSIPTTRTSRGAMFLVPESLDRRGAQRDGAWSRSCRSRDRRRCRFLRRRQRAWGCDRRGVRLRERLQLQPAHRGWWIRARGSYAGEHPAQLLRAQHAEERGIAYDAANGVNPFQLSFVGGLDNHKWHNAGPERAIDYARHGAHGNQSFATSSQILNESSSSVSRRGRQPSPSRGPRRTRATRSSRHSRDAGRPTRPAARVRSCACSAVRTCRRTCAAAATSPCARLRQRRPDGRYARARRYRRHRALRGERAHGSRLAEPPRHEARPASRSHQGLGRRERRVARAGVRRPRGRRHDADPADTRPLPAAIRPGGGPLRTRRPDRHRPARACVVSGRFPGSSTCAARVLRARVLEQPSCRWNQ